MVGHPTMKISLAEIESNLVKKKVLITYNTSKNIHFMVTLLLC